MPRYRNTYGDRAIDQEFDALDRRLKALEDAKAAASTPTTATTTSSTGIAGAAGPTGAVGPMGPMGYPGFDGSEGEEGWPGPPGLAGAAGLRGFMGPPGEDGAEGEPGPGGAQGVAGATGAIGATGAAGISGPPGAEGESGEDAVSLGPSPSFSTRPIVAVINDGGGVIAAGSKGYAIAAHAGTIVSATMVADQSGSIAIEVRKCTYAQFDAGSTHPVTGDKINASAPPTITTATKSQDTTLTGWTVSFARYDIFEFVVNSAATSITKATLTLETRV